VFFGDCIEMAGDRPKQPVNRKCSGCRTSHELC